jgi:ABC-type multidrug transport system ATPase subunit
VGIIHEGRLVVEAPQEELLERYAVPAFEIETENGRTRKLEGWLDELAALDWVAATSLDARAARVVVRDVEQAKHHLPALALETGLVLTRYEMVRPSLEDVFMQLVGEGGD